MVNLTALERIIQFIRKDKRIKKMKSWSERFRVDSNIKHNLDIRKLKKQVIELLNLISGDNIIEMIEGLQIIIFYKKVLYFKKTFFLKISWMNYFYQNIKLL